MHMRFSLCVCACVRTCVFVHVCVFVYAYASVLFVLGVRIYVDVCGSLRVSLSVLACTSV